MIQKIVANIEYCECYVQSATYIASVNLRKYTVKSHRHIHINPIVFHKYWQTHTQTIMKNSNTIFFGGGGFTHFVQDILLTFSFNL